jgi:hypothetical protein
LAASSSSLGIDDQIHCSFDDELGLGLGQEGGEYVLQQELRFHKPRKG